MSFPSDLSVEEIIAYLRRSEIPAVLVEGRDDMTVYRWIEDSAAGALGVVIPCGGRGQVLELARRQGEIGSRNVVFLVDSDCDCVWGVDENIENIIWTDGYSIENDLFGTGVIRQLMTRTEQVNFDRVVGLLVEWFLYSAISLKEGQTANLCCHSREVVDHDSFELRNNCVIEGDLEVKYSDACNRVRQESLKYVRGKNLFDSSLVYLSARRRRSKYSRQNLYELCAVNFRNSPELQARVQRIQRILDLEEAG